MLDVEYSSKWKADNGYDDAPLSRRVNGEHELRLETWEETFANTGFELQDRKELRTVNWEKLIKASLLCLPFPLRKLLDIWPSRVRPQKGEVIWYLTMLAGFGKEQVFVRSSHDYTLFLAQKR
jgi:hypothetical protein